MRFLKKILIQLKLAANCLLTAWKVAVLQHYLLCSVLQEGCLWFWTLGKLFFVDLKLHEQVTDKKHTKIGLVIKGQHEK